MSPQQLAYRAAHYTPWHARIGDGGWVAWLTTAAYLIAAILCLRAAWGAASAARPERKLWAAAGTALLAFGVNKQLDLQFALTEFWRENALAHGWYGARRTVQRAVFFLAIAGAAAGALWLAPRVRRGSVELKLAFAGLAVIGGYVALRAAKFHHILSPGPVKADGPGWLALIELSGIALTGFAAWRYR